MSIHNDAMLNGLLAQHNLTPNALGLNNAKTLDRVELPSYTPSFLERLSVVDKIVIASGFLIATSLLILGALAIRAEVISVKNGSFLTKITAKGGYSMIGTAAGVALITALFVKFYSTKPAKELPSTEGYGLQEGNHALFFGDFDPAKHKSPRLFVVNDQGELWHKGRKTTLDKVTVNDLPPGMELTQYKAGGTTLFTSFSYQVMKMLLPPYYQADFAAMKRF